MENRLYPVVPARHRNFYKAGSPPCVAERLGAGPAQVAIAWLLKKSPIMLPIPGTSSVKHLEENATAALLELPDSVMKELP